MEEKQKTSRPHVPRGFVAETASALGSILAEQRATNEHLKTLNGRTGKSEDRIAAIEKTLAEQAGEEKANGRLIALAKRGAPWAGVIIAGWLTGNGQQVFQLLKGMVGAK